MKKIPNEKYKSSPLSSKYKNIKYTIIIGNNSMESKISSILKKYKEELNAQSQKLQIEKKELNKIKMELKTEQLKFGKINNKIISIEKEIERIKVDSTKITKKKLFSKSSIIKHKKLFKSSNIPKKYIFLLNIGLDRELKNLESLDLIIDDDNDESCYYLEYLEKCCIKMAKEKKEEFIKLKKYINDYLEDDNITAPYDKLLLFFNFIFQNIDLSNSLKEKYDDLEGEESKKNIIDIEIRNLEFEKSEKEKLIKEIYNYIELLKNIAQQYIYYRNQYKNKTISKEILSKKMKKIQSINIKKWNPENKNRIYFNKKKNNSYISNNRNKSAIFTTKNKKKFFKNHKKYESKSQNNSRNTSFDYLIKDGPLIKKNFIEPIDVPTKIFDSFSKYDNDKENVSENNDNESPISKINSTTRKKNTIHVYKKKLSVQIMKKFPISSNINNCFNSITKNNEIKKTDSKTIYVSKNNSINNIIKEKKTNSTSRIYKENRDSESDTIHQNKKVINKKKYIFKDEESKNNNNKKKEIYFLKKNKNKKFIINKKKLFNQDLPTKIKANTIKKKNTFNVLQTNEERDIIMSNKNINKGKNSISQDKQISLNSKGRNDNNKIFFKTNYNEIRYENDVNFEVNRNCKNIFNGIYSKRCSDSIKSIKDEMKKRNLLSINKGSMTREFKKNEIKADFQRDNCCISCT